MHLKYNYRSRKNKQTSFATYTIMLLLGIMLLINGCVKMEATRKADWETNFTGLHFVNAKKGWIVGLGGIIVHTADGGKTWQRQEVDTTADFKAVYFANEKDGWAVGDDGLIVTTDDGGRFWSVQKSGIISNVA